MTKDAQKNSFSKSVDESHCSADRTSVHNQILDKVQALSLEAEQNNCRIRIEPQPSGHTYNVGRYEQLCGEDAIEDVIIKEYVDIKKHVDIEEFRDKGYLQELNRQFLHPLGMTLEVVVEDDGTEMLQGIIDCRDDPEGIIFEEECISKDKAEFVRDEFERKSKPRFDKVGYVIQPAGCKDTRVVKIPAHGDDDVLVVRVGTNDRPACSKDIENIKECIDSTDDETKFLITHHAVDFLLIPRSVFKSGTKVVLGGEDKEEKEV